MKIHSLLIGSVTALSWTLMAADINERIVQLEASMNQVRTETLIPSYGAKNPSDHPDNQPWKVSFDVIYWHPKVDGTTYAYSADSSTAAIPLNAALQDVSMKWAWGFKAGIGRNFGDEGDLYAEYTYFNEGPSSKISAGGNSTVVPLKGYPSLPEDDTAVFYCLDANSNVAFDFQTIDLLLRHGYFVNKRVMLRPAMGLKAALIDIDQTSRYTGGTADPLDATSFGLGRNTQLVKDTNHFSGLGPMLGVNMLWLLSSEFSVYGDVAGGLLYGRFRLKHKENYTANPSRYINVTESIHRLSPMAAMSLGLGYDVYPCARKYHLGIFLGYETQFWFKQNVTMYVQGDQKYTQEISQSLNLYGITLSFLWEF